MQLASDHISVGRLEATWHAGRMPNRNMLSLHVRPSRRTGTDEVDIMVDGVHLYALLGLRRRWTAPPRSVLCPPSDHLFGGADGWETPSLRWFEDGRQALFNLAADIEERHDLAAGQPERVAHLAALLDAWSEDVVALIPRPNPTPYFAP